MKKCFILICLFVSSIVSGNAQKAPKDDNLPKLVSVYQSTYYEDIFERLDTTLLTIGNTINSEKETLAVRVCSNDPLPIALAFAAGKPFYITANVGKYNPNIPDVFFLRQNRNCKIVNNERFVTEYWIVPKNAEFPEFIEIRKAESIAISELSSYTELETAFVIPGEKSGISNLKNKALQFMKQNRTALILFQTPTLKSTNKTIAKEILQIKRFLTENGIGSNRIFVKQSSDIASKESKYPLTAVISQK